MLILKLDGRNLQCQIFYNLINGYRNLYGVGLFVKCKYKKMHRYTQFAALRYCWNARFTNVLANDNKTKAYVTVAIVVSMSFHWGIQERSNYAAV